LWSGFTGPAGGADEKEALLREARELLRRWPSPELVRAIRSVEENPSRDALDRLKVLLHEVKRSAVDDNPLHIAPPR